MRVGHVPPCAPCRGSAVRGEELREEVVRLPGGTGLRLDHRERYQELEARPCRGSGPVERLLQIVARLVVAGGPPAAEGRLVRRPAALVSEALPQAGGGDPVPREVVLIAAHEERLLRN